MPLLRRKPFISENPPSDLDPDEEVLFCDLTGEIFRNYDAFYERVILCNSLLWTCERTGRSGLTYKEAFESEQNVAKLLDAFPRPLANAVLNIVHHTRRSKIADLCDEIYDYLRCRYVEGEKVEVRLKDSWEKASIAKSSISTYVNGFVDGLSSLGKAKDTPKKSKSISPQKVPTQDEGVEVPSPGSPIDNKACWPDAKQSEYVVRFSNSGSPVTLKGKNVRRPKGILLKDTIRLFIRKTCVRSTPSSDDGFWVVVDKFVEEYRLGPTTVTTQHANNLPNKNRRKRKHHNAEGISEENTTDDSTPKKKKKKKYKHNESKNSKEGKKKKKKKGGHESASSPKSKTSKESTKENKEPKKDKTKDGPKVEDVDASKLSEEERKKLIEELKLKRKLEREEERKRKCLEKEEDKKRRKLEREMEKEKLGKVRILEAKFLKEWTKQKEDLKLENLQELPGLETVQSKVPPEMFGDVLMVTEFLNAFGPFYQLKEEVQYKVTVELIEEALLEHDVEGRYYELLKFLLQTFLRVSQEENDEEEETTSSDGTNTPAEQEEVEDKTEDNALRTASAGATAAAAWPMLHQGQALHELTVDAFTLSEILRLHILSSGVKIGGARTLWQRRGGFQYNDDPCVHFRHRETELLSTLSSGCVYDLSPSGKLKVLCVLCDQLLTLATTRDYIEEAFDKIKELKKQLRELQFSEHRRRKTEAAERYKRRLCERAKMKEEILRRKKEKAEREGEMAKEKLTNDGTETSSPPVKNAQEDKNNTEKIPDEEPTLTLVKLTDITKEEEENENQQRELFKQREKELMNELLQYSAINGESPLGRDRALNRYWALASVDGLLMETSDADIKVLMESNDNEGGSDEESASDDDDEVQEQASDKDCKAPQSETPSEALPRVSLSEIMTLKQNQSPLLLPLLHRYKCDTKLSESDVVSQSKVFDKALNEVRHAVNPENYIDLKSDITKWHAFDKKSTVINFVDNLNERGVRENGLKSNLKSKLERICESVDSCMLLERSDLTPLKASKTGDSVDKSLFKSMNDFLEANLRDQILDFEERIWNGGLGIIKVDDRSLWRKKLDEGMAKLIMWGTEGVGKMPEEKSEKTEDISSLTNGHASETETAVTPLQTAKKGSVQELEEKPSRLLALKVQNRPCAENVERCSTPTSLCTPTVTSIVKELGSAVLQIEKGIERKFLKPPLGENEERKKERIKEMIEAATAEYNEMMVKAKQEKKKKKQMNGNSKDSIGISNGEKQSDESPGAIDDDTASVGSSASEELKKERTCLERWETSLKAACNLSQLFIHLNTLDHSIMWDKSVLNARCKKCRRKGDAEQMLLCDGCDRGFHMYCLVPPMKQVPQGDWFCHDCRPKETRRSARRRTVSKTMYESEDDEGDEDNSDGSEDVSEDDIEEESDDESSECEETEDSSQEEEDEDDDQDDEEEDESESEDEDSSHHGDYCSICEGTGTLLCCDSCSRAYHTLCTYPPMKKVPKGSWSCQVCTRAENELPRAKRVVTLEREREKEKKAVMSKRKLQKGSRSKSVPQRIARNQTPGEGKTGLSRNSKRKRAQSASPQTGRPQKVRKETDTPTLRERTAKSAPKSPKGGKGVRKSSTFTFGRYERRQCSKLLEELMRQEEVEPFLAPVDTKLVPDYRQYIDRPMDFGTIKRNINAAHYNALDEFLEDVRLVFKNCETYNAPRSTIARAGTKLSLYFEQRLREMELC